MKINSSLRAALLFPLINVAFAACKQPIQQTAKTGQSSTTASKANGSNLISFKVNGTKVISSGWTISRFSYSENPAAQWLNVTSNMHDEKRTININLSGIRPGDYALGTGSAMKSSHGSYYPDYLEDLGNSYSFQKGTFHIESLDTMNRTLNASFSGTVRNLKGEVIEITEGRIENGLLNIGVIRY